MKKILFGAFFAVILCASILGFYISKNREIKDISIEVNQVDQKNTINKFNEKYEALDEESKKNEAVKQLRKEVNRVEVDEKTIKEKTKELDDFVKRRSEKQTEYTKKISILKENAKENLQNEKIKQLISELYELVKSYRFDEFDVKSQQISELLKNKKQLNQIESDARVINVPTIQDYKIVVNKKNPLPETYAPGENPVAKNAFLKLKADMQALGFKIGNHYSGYRSYELQVKIYNSIVNAVGSEEADKVSARPGYSEHQTGLVFDLTDTNGELLAVTKKLDGAADWLEKNAHRYGFVVRYTKGKEKITGYNAEPWHIRFVGNDASDIYASNKTLEEYYGVEGGNYKE